MGKVVVVRVQLWNSINEELVRLGILPKEALLIEDVEALADTAATMLVLPKDLVERLSLPIVREEATVTYANGYKEKKLIASEVKLKVLNCTGLFECVVEEPGTKPLIGQVPLEVLDLIVDCKRGTIGPRPESPDTPLIEL